MKKLIERVNTVEELFIGYALLAIAVTACVQVALRYIFGLAYDWIEELSRYMTILITFVGAGICVRTGAHFSMDAVVQYSPDRLKHLLKALANLVSAVIMIVVFYFAWVQIEKLHRFSATTPSLRIPMFIPYLPIGVFTGVIALRFVIQTGHHAIGFFTNAPFEAKKKGGH
jgi:C4-dicarboxylate transporter DctQ subunit